MLFFAKYFTENERLKEVVISQLGSDHCFPSYRNQSIDLHCKLTGFYMMGGHWPLIG